MQLKCSLAYQEAMDLVQFFIDRYHNQVSIRWAISLHNQPQLLIGTCGFHPFDNDNSRVEIGYDLAVAYWRRGIMTEALHAMLHYGFATLNLHRIEAVTTPENYASRRLLEKLGFRLELADGRQFMLSAIDDFDIEIAQTRQNEKLMAFLDQRGRQTQTISLDEVKRQLGLS
jgi:ribosomal-protein-alanine N-acetyltransferase